MKIRALQEVDQARVEKKDKQQGIQNDIQFLGYPRKPMEDVHDD
jgi:hypothetical protein